VSSVTVSIEDRLAIQDLIARHGHLMDDGAFDRLDELFTADVVYDLTAFGAGELHGPAAIGEAGRAMGDWNPVAHQVTNVLIAGNADGAVTVRSKGFGVRRDGTTGSVVYEDVLRRTVEGWRIAYRKVVAR
jgi:3-phenylpropionate/cinnamic acid dioxygenase small subunit